MRICPGTVTSLTAKSLARFCDFDKNKRFYFKIFKKIALLCTNYSVNCANKSIKNSISKPFISPLIVTERSETEDQMCGDLDSTPRGADGVFL